MTVASISLHKAMLAFSLTLSRVSPNLRYNDDGQPYLIHIYFISHWLVVDRHKLTVFYPKSFDMDSVQVGKAVFDK